MFAAGVSTFVLLYATQPLLPLLARDFAVSPADSMLTLALTTGTLALALLPAGWLSDAWGRTRVMQLALIASAALGLLAAAAPSFPALLAIRALQGVALAGIPAVAHGLPGRGDPPAVARCLDWAVHRRQRIRWHVRATDRWSARGSWRLAAGPAHDRGQLCLGTMAARLMGTFVAVYNGLGFRLQAPPYGLGGAAIAAIFLVYPIGSLSSGVAGRLADRLGRRRVLPVGVLIAVAGVAVTALHPLPLVIAGIALLTVGFFAAHSVASSWVGRRAHSGQAQAAALYLLAYYAGSSIAGPLGGTAWTAGGWTDVMVLAAVMLAVALAVAMRMRTMPPARPAPAPVL
jgi:MFS transporter, YNFM family, putative membrane transport protein